MSHATVATLSRRVRALSDEARSEAERAVRRAGDASYSARTVHLARELAESLRLDAARAAQAGQDPAAEQR